MPPAKRKTPMTIFHRVSFYTPALKINKHHRLLENIPSNSMIPCQSPCKKVLPLLSLVYNPNFSALRPLLCSKKKMGAATKGRMIAKQPNPHFQFTLSRKPSAALEPANAVII